MAENTDPIKGPLVEELRDGQHVIGYYLARNPRLEAFRDPSRGNYMRMILADRSGEIDARMWEEAEEFYPQVVENPIVKVEGEVETFRDQLQVKILRLRVAAPGEVALRDLRPTTQRDLGDMNIEIDRAIEKIRDPHISKLLQFFFEDPIFRRDYQECPAAIRIHHAYIGGLLEHICEVLRLSEPLVELYPEINRDLLIAGILLHDVGKLEEYTWEIDIAYTDRGRLIGHVVLGTEKIAQAMENIPDFPEALALQLHHMILSHHGRYEFGSPRRPKTLEAIALHHLENLDAQVNRFKSLIEVARKRDQVWTGYDPLLGRSLYTAEEGDFSIEERGHAN